MRVFAGAVLFLLCFLGTGFAQIPQANIFIGYSYLSADVPNTSTRRNLNGWEGSLEGKVLPFLGLVVDGSGHYGTTQIPACGVPVSFGGSCAGVNGTLYTALFGPRVSASFHGVRPFAHFLVGAADISGVNSDVSLASAFGAGVDLKLAPIIGWRFQGDYIHTHFSGTAQAHARISTGIVFRF
jgi:hypothetical protein